MKLDTPIETTQHMWQTNESYRNSLLQHKLWGKYFTAMAEDARTKHDISSDNLPGEIDFTTNLVPPRTPELVGTELIQTINVTIPTTKFPVIKTTDIGQSAKQAKGITNPVSRADRVTYMDLELQTAWNTQDRVNQDFIEDSQQGVLTWYWNSLYRIHRQLISLKYIEQIVGVKTSGNTNEDASGNPYTELPKTVSGSEGNFDLDLFIDAHTRCLEANFVPDCVLMTPIAHAKFLKNEDFKSNEYFQEYANYDSGMIASILGCKIFVSNQVKEAYKNTQTGGADAADNKIWMWNKDRFAVAAMRRNEMIMQIRDEDKMEEGLSISSRLGFAYKDAGSMVVATVSG